MANILKEYHEIVNPSANMGLRDVSVLLTVGSTKRYIPVSELYIRRNDSATKQVSNVNELMKMLEEGKLYWSVTDQPISAGLNLDSIGFFRKNFELPEQYITDTYQGDTAVPVGLNRVLEVKRTADFSGDYLYCQLAEDASRDLYAKDDIGYVENGRVVTLAGKTKAEVERIMETQVLYIISTSKQVLAVFTDASCQFGKVLKTESVDLSNMTKNVFEYNARGEVVEKKLQVDDRYTEQVFRKDGEDAYLDTYNYIIGKGQAAKYIRVQYEGETVESLIDIGAAYYVKSNGTLGKAVDATSFRGDGRFSFIGQRLGIKLKGDNGEEVVRMTTPLTLDQVTACYERLKTMNETTSDEDILSDDTYIKLADGRYMKEKAAAKPICYDFVLDNSDDFDAYCVEVGSSAGEQTLILTKEEFAKHKSMTWMHGDVTIDKRRAFKIKRSTKEMKYADVVQLTTEGKGIEESLSLADPSYEGGRVQLRRLLNVDEQCAYCQEEFEALYKKGKYKIDQVLDEDGKWVKVDSKGKRYKYDDHVSLHDYSNDRPEYAYFKQCKYEYDGKRLIGGKPYDAKKGIKGDYKKLRETSAKLLTFAFSGAGVICFPVTFGIFVYLPARALYIPVKHWVKKMQFDRTNAHYANKLSIHRKHLKKDIEQELKDIYENTIKASEDNRLNRNNMLDRFESLDQMIYSLAETKFLADFRMVKGKGRVTESNAELFSKYRTDMKQLEKDIKKLERKAKRDPSLAHELAAKKQLHSQKIKDYVSQGIIEPKDPKFRELISRSNIMKGYLLERFYGEELSEQQKSELDQMYALYVKKGDKLLTPSKMQTLLNQPDKLANLRDLARECMVKGRATRYNYEENLMSNQGYSTNGIGGYRADAVKKVEKKAESYVSVEKEEQKKMLEEEVVKTPTPEMSKQDKHKKARESALAKLAERDKKLAESDGEVITLGGETPQAESDREKRRKAAQEAKLKEIAERDKKLAETNGEVIHLGGTVPTDTKAPATETEEKKPAAKKQPKAYDTKIISEDRLIVLLKANPESKDRRRLIKYIEEKLGKQVKESDIQKAIDRITDMHKDGLNATTGAGRGNVAKILKYGQEYLTQYARDVKFWANPSDDGMTV